MSKKDFLNKLYHQYDDPSWLGSDPVQFAHRYTLPEDQEVVALLSVCFAYGSAKLVIRAVEEILRPLGKSPYKALLKYKGEKLWPGFVYRFHKEEHLIILCSALSKILRDFKSIGNFYRSHYLQKSNAEESAFENMLNGTHAWFSNEFSDYTVKQKKLEHGLKFFFNSPAQGSACKRMVMFLRFMARKDKVDLGLWSWLPTDELVIPVDTHVARISHYLHLRKGKEELASNWKMAREITENLKKLDAIDPVKYDFGLSRLGILNICKKKKVDSICSLCPLLPGCRYGQKNQSEILFESTQ